MSPNPPGLSIQTGPARLGPVKRLEVKVAALFVVVALLLAVLAWVAGRGLVQGSLVDDTQRAQRESGLRVVQSLQTDLARAQSLASAIAVTLSPGVDAASSQARLSALLARSGLASVVAAVGIWPEPASQDGPRNSRYWLVDDQGALVARNDYNDPRAVPYWQEAWYTPARIASAERCNWTTVQTEALSKRQVIGCVLPLRAGTDFRGAVTLWLDVLGLERALRRNIGEQSGYSLVLDREDRLIASTGIASKTLDSARPRNMAALAQKMTAFNPLSLDLHQRQEDALEAAKRSKTYDAAQITNLQKNTRDLSLKEAESIYAAWSTAPSPASTDPIALPRVDNDPLLGEDGAVALFEIPDAGWTLVRVSPAREGLAGVEHFFNQTLLLVLVALGLSLTLIFLGLRTWVLRPLSQMARSLGDARSLEESLHVQLDDRATSEIGQISHWYNERLRQLREASDRVMTQQSQLVIEAGERARADEQALRLRERSSAVLSSIADAAIVVDAKGLIEDMNAPAERLIGVALRAVRGKPCADILRLRLASESSSAADFVSGVIASSGRVEHNEGLFLQVEGRGEREIQLMGSPLRGIAGRSLGATLVFRAKETSTASPKLVFDRRSVDPITGLPNRSACDRRLRSLLDASRVLPRKHALLLGDIDRLRQINETMGLQAGDAALVRVAELLVDLAPGGDVFRLGADAFAILIENTDEDGARRTAQLAIETIAATQFQWTDKSFSLTASFGLSVFDGTVEHPMQVISRAEAACRAAKAGGNSTFKVYDKSMERRTADDSTWIRRIRAGLDEGFLHLTTQWIQPADAHLAEGAVYEVSFAVEDEEGFWAEPAAVVPVAERNGLISEIERWTIRSMLRHLAANPAIFERLAYCYVSLSAATLADGATLEMLVHEFEAYPQVPTSRICFALREAVLTEAPGAAQTFCTAMRSIGCRVALDQFVPRGAAASDLLRRLQTDFIRVDARLFADVASNPVDLTMADSLARLSRVLKRRLIVTELVNENSRDAWKRMGADYLQGPAISRASPVIFAGNT